MAAASFSIRGLSCHFTCFILLMFVVSYLLHVRLCARGQADLQRLWHYLGSSLRCCGLQTYSSSALHPQLSLSRTWTSLPWHLKDVIAPTVINAPFSLPAYLLSFQLLADAKLAYKAWMRPS